MLFGERIDGVFSSMSSRKKERTFGKKIIRYLFVTADSPMGAEYLNAAGVTSGIMRIVNMCRRPLGWRTLNDRIVNDFAINN